MRLLAPAKINLHLRVFRARSDGFHPLLSWMCTVGLFDTLEIQRGSNGIALTCDDPTIPCDARNLVHRAAQLILADRAQKPTALPWGDVTRDGATSQGVKIHLHKQIPSGGGLGGGSSDGARTLIGLNRFFGANLALQDLSLLAARLGSDVPFFLYGP